MTKSIDPRPHAVAGILAMPTQRIVTKEPAASSLALDEVGVDLPNLAAVLGSVPGGLGADVVESFTYADQRWTAADARISGTPIGLQLAMEQRGLDC